MPFWFFSCKTVNFGAINEIFCMKVRFSDTKINFHHFFIYDLLFQNYENSLKFEFYAKNPIFDEISCQIRISAFDTKKYDEF